MGPPRHTTRWKQQHEPPPTQVVLAIDVKGAFPSVHRDAAYEVARLRAPHIARAMEHWYSEPGRKVYRGPKGTESIYTSTGVDQGDPLAGAVYSLAQTLPLERLVAMHPNVAYLSFYDDTYILVDPAELDAVMATINAEWAKIGLQINPTKTKIFTPSPETAAQIPPHWQPARVDSLPFLGQHLRMHLGRNDPATFTLGGAPSLQTNIDQLRTLHTKLRELTTRGLTCQSAHDIWVHCTAGVTTHLFSTTAYQ